MTSLIADAHGTVEPAVAEDASICDGGISMINGGSNGGVFLPVGGNWERRWGPEVQAAIALAGLLYCFAGVANIADVFMAAIEKLTSKKMRVEIAGRKRTVRVWNPTVANLSLMALGSSAPEILLSIIELFSNNMQSGELGPSTIVGSAAFNLFCIIAVCVSTIPSGETRIIKETGVFAITSMFSIFAYVWLLVILMWRSPNVVEWWEGVLTFMYFPVLCLLAYLADIGWFHSLCKMSWDRRTNALVLTAESTEEDKNEMIMRIRQKYGNSHAVSQNMEDLLHYEFGPKPTRAHRRMKSTRDILGGKSIRYRQLSTHDHEHGQELTSNLLKEKRRATLSMPRSFVEWECIHHAVAESDKVVELALKRTGDLSQPCVVHVRTEDGTATAPSDYDSMDENITFKSREHTKKLRIGIKEDSEWEDQEDFKVIVSRPAGPGSSLVGIGKNSIARVVIIDSDNPGVLKFAREEVTYEESPDVTAVSVDVLRTKGTNGRISCSYRTEDGTAYAGFDYKSVSGLLTFEKGEAHKCIALELLPNGRWGNQQGHFRVVIENATGGAAFDMSTDGADESCILTVVIRGDQDQADILRGLMLPTPSPTEMAISNSNWKEQFVEAIYVGGSPAEQSQAGITAWVCHLILLPWKLLCAMVPPPSLCDGAVCFVVALVVIGVLTAIIGDLANTLGCALHMEPSITAITIVAIGTSLPDTFASMTAAVQDPTADNSVGNVTGSNSVNVFLGLGLPWGIGSLYWYFMGVDLEDENDPWVKHGKKVGWWDELPEIKEQWPATLVVPAGSLGISVLAFAVGALVCLAAIVARRCLLGAELGGPDCLKYTTSAIFVLLWVAYIAVSIVFARS